MFHRENEVLRAGTGIAVPGATITVYVNGTDTAGDYTNATKATIYPSNVVGTPIANSTLVADANGEYHYFVPDGVYDEVLHYGSITAVDTYIQMFDLEDAAQGTIAAETTAIEQATIATTKATQAAASAASAASSASSAGDDSASASASADTAVAARDGAVTAANAALASENAAETSASNAAVSETNALAAAGGAAASLGMMVLALFSAAATATVPVGTDLIQTNGYSAKGVGGAKYVYDAAVDAAYVTANPRTSFRTVNGRGFRILIGANDEINPDQFGVTRGDTGSGAANGANNNAAWSALFAAGLAVAQSDGPDQYLPPIKLGSGTIEVTSPVTPPATCNLIGNGNGNWSDTTVAAGSCIKAYGCTAISATFGKIIAQDMVLQGDFVATEAEYHGVAFNQRVYLVRVDAHGFAGDGFNADGGPGHLPDDSVLIDCDGRGNRNGTNFGLTGGNADTNVIRVVGGIFNSNRQCAHLDLGRLGNKFDTTESNGNGVTSWNDGVTGPASIVSFNGNRYQAIYGQEVGASTNAPSGDTTDNTWWIYNSAGGVSAGRPAWFSGMLVRAGGPLITTSAVAPTVAIACYAEAGQGLAQVVCPTQVIGGVLSTMVWRGSSGVVQRVGGTSLNSWLDVSPSVAVTSGFQGGDGTTVNAQLGEMSSSQRTILRMQGSGLTMTRGRALKFKDGASGDIVLDTGQTAPYVFFITGPTSAKTGGTGAPLPNAFVPRILLVGDDGTTDNDSARRIMVTTAAPSGNAHGQGDFAFFRGSTTGQLGFACRTGGTPGTWETFWNGLSIGSRVGFTTGAGGTVTQNTSKATAVTLNKLTGQVTMNAASLAANTIVTFTLNSSQILADDEVRVWIKSGNASPGSYRVAAEGNSAGSRTIVVENKTAGALAEALVLGFSVLSAAIS